MPTAKAKKAASPKGALSLTPAYRNKLEKSIAAQLEAGGVAFKFEAEKIPYKVPERTAKYLYDFRGDGTDIILEGKGWFGRGAKERQKLILIRESNPHLDIRIVFSDANKKIYKGSPTTYGDWATFHGFKWSTKGEVPQSWIDDIKKEAKRCKRKTSK